MIRIALGLAKPARNLTLGCLLLATAALGVAAARAYPTTDLFCFTTAARLLTLGGDPYDAATWAAATAGTFPDYRGVPRSSPCPGRFGYPLWTAFAILPAFRIHSCLPTRGPRWYWTTMPTTLKRPRRTFPFLARSPGGF